MKRYSRAELVAFLRRLDAAAAVTSTERRELELLLKEAEFSEAREDPEQRFDVAVVRHELGL